MPLFPYSTAHAALVLALWGSVPGCAGSSNAAGQDAAATPSTDWRNVRTGYEIPSLNYADQPYIIELPTGEWLAVLTTGIGGEHADGQHIISSRSSDEGKTWSPHVAIEPPEGPHASWAVPLLVPSGRVYVFYTYNGDEVVEDNPQHIGWYCFKYTDDGGRTWSSDRYRIPLRITDADRNNDYSGLNQMFWGVGNPLVRGSDVYIPISKIGRYVLSETEGWLVRSPNILTEPDPEKIEWSLLPDGENPILGDLGDVQEEHNIVALPNGDLYVMFRTVQGAPGHAYSSDGGMSWSDPTVATYRPGGRQIKNPRAFPKIFRLACGRYLLWFHNQGQRNYQGRNPVWLSAGEVVDGAVHWSEPEILLYDPDETILGMSYPDWLESHGRLWVTETQKRIARVHEIPQGYLAKLLAQGSASALPEATQIAVSYEGPDAGTVPMPSLPALAEGGGFSIALWIQLTDYAPGKSLLDSRDAAGRGVYIETSGTDQLSLTLDDGTSTGSWDVDPGLLSPGKVHHVVFTVDGGPKIISVVVDGQLADGGVARTHGWTRFPQSLGLVSGGPTLRVGSGVQALQVYRRALMTSEAVSVYQGER